MPLFCLKERVARRVATAFTALFVASAPMTTGAAAEEFRIKYGAFHSASETFIQVITKMMENVTQRTEGKVTFEPYYGGSLLKAPDLYPGMARGAVDMVTSVPHAFNPQEFPLSGITLPFTTDNVFAATIAYRDWYRQSPEVQAEFQRNNAFLLFGWPVAENVLWTKKPVRTAADLKGMRIRMLLGPGEAFSLLGATAVAVPYTEAIELLERGGVDGITTTFLEQGVRDGLGDVATYLSSGGRMGIFAVTMTSIRGDLWERLPQDVKDIFLDEAEKATTDYLTVVDSANDRAVDQLIAAKKVEVIEIDEAEERRWRELTEGPLHANYIERAKTVGADGQALMDRFRALVSENEPTHPYVTGIARYQARLKQ